MAKRHPKRPKRKKPQAPPANKVLVWSGARCEKFDPQGWRRRVWKTKCGRFRVEEITIMLAKDSDPYPMYYLAMTVERFPTECTRIISEHRKLKTAQDACERKAQQ